MKNIFFIVGLLLFTSISVGFTYPLTEIKGSVIDANTKTPLVGAILTISDLRINVASDERGEFVFKNVPNRGVFLVEIRFLGYTTISKNIDFSKNEPLVFALKESIIEGQEVVVTGSGSSSDKRQNSTSIASVSKADLLNRPSTNLIDAISRVAGVSQITTGNGISKPIIRGLGYNRVLTMSNGIKQEGQQWGDEHGIEIDQFSADKIEILKGPASLMYGSDALGGVINVIDALPAPYDTTQGELISNYTTNGGLTANSLMLQSNRNGLTYRFRGSYKNAFSYQTPERYVPNSGFNETNFSGQLGINKTWGYAHIDFSTFKNRIGFYDPVVNTAGDFIDENGHLFTTSDFKNRTLAFPQQDISHEKIALNSNIIFNSGNLKTTLGFQNNLRKEISTENDEKPTLFLKMETYNYDIKYSFRKNNGWEPTLGISGEVIDSENTSGAEQLIPNYHAQTAGAFAYLKKIWTKETFNIGVRFDYHNLDAKAFEDKFQKFNNTFKNVSGAIGFTHEFNDKLSFKSNLGSAFRAPNIAELSSNGVHEGAFRYEIGNPDLKPEQSFQFDASIDYQSDKISANLATFANYINQYIYYKNTNRETIVAEGDTYPLYRFTQDNAFLRGGEVSLTLHPVDYFHFENNFSYTLATNKATDSPLPFIPAAVLRNELRFEPKISGTKKTYFSIELDNFFAQNKIADFETPSVGYSLLNIGAGTTFKISKKQKITVYLSGKNMLNKKYYDHLSRFKPGRLDASNPEFGIYNPGRSITFGINLPFEL